MADIQTSVTEWGDIIKNAVNEIATDIGDFLPTALSALVLFIFGLVVAGSFSKLAKRILSAKNVSHLVDNKKVHEGLKKAGIEWTISDMIAKFTYWIIVLITLMSVSNVLGLTVLSDTLQRLVAYVPNVIAAVIVIALAIAASRVVRDFVVAGLTTLNVSFTKVIGSVVEGIVITFGVVMAVAQLGFDTTIVTANITVIVAGAVAMLALSLGMGTKELVRSISVKHYAEKTFKKGQKITIGEHSGKVKTTSNLGIVLETSQGDVFVPNNQLV